MGDMYDCREDHFSTSFFQDEPSMPYAGRVRDRYKCPHCGLFIKKKDHFCKVWNRSNICVK